MKMLRTTWNAKHKNNETLDRAITHTSDRRTRLTTIGNKNIPENSITIESPFEFHCLLKVTDACCVDEE